jgi:hypothetical protein
MTMWYKQSQPHYRGRPQPERVAPTHARLFLLPSHGEAPLNEQTPRGREPNFTRQDLAVAWQLDLGVDFAGRSVPLLDTPQPCHKYENACVCPECVERQRITIEPRTEAAQPWDAKPARAA